MSQPEKTSSGASDPLQQRIIELVEEFEAALKGAKEKVPEVFRSFCLLAHGWKMDPEEFRWRLVRAGLPASRASEIKAVLSVDKAKLAFITREPAMSWAKALGLARAIMRGNYGFNNVQELAAELVKLMHRSGQTSLEIQEGTFELRERHISIFEIESVPPTPPWELYE